jgi:hypothetical protein
MNENDPIMDGAEDHILVAKRSEHVNPIAFGRVLGRLDAQAEDIQELKSGLKDNSAKLDRLLEFQAKQKGAATVLTMVASALAAFIGWVSSHIFKW